jgi:serine/threonine-protein kinase
VSDRLGGRYLCLAEIGAGGTAVVHRARDERTGGEVAVKELRPQFALNRVTRRRFLQEAELARSSITRVSCA